MAVTSTHTGTLQHRDRRTTVFVTVTALLAVVFLGVGVIVGGVEFFIGWILKDGTEEIHLWHIAELGALSILLLAGPLLALLRNPQEKPLLAQFFLLSLSILAIGLMPFEIKAASLFIIVIVFMAAHPNVRDLVTFKQEGPISLPLLGLTLLIALFIVPTAWQELQWQIVGTTQNDVHALDFHWIVSAVLMTMLVLGGLLASTRRPGWKQLATITGIIYCYLGIVAMLLPLYAGSWHGAGGLFAIIAGVWYIIIASLEARWSVGA